jgi:hypothetical protein
MHTNIQTYESLRHQVIRTFQANVALVHALPHPILDHLLLKTADEALALKGMTPLMLDEIMLDLGHAGYELRSDTTPMAVQLVKNYPYGAWTIPAELYSSIWGEASGEVDGLILIWSEVQGRALSLGDFLDISDDELIDVATERFYAQFGPELSNDHIVNAVHTLNGYFSEMVPDPSDQVAMHTWGRLNMMV